MWVASAKFQVPKFKKQAQNYESTLYLCSKCIPRVLKGSVRELVLKATLRRSLAEGLG